MSDKAIADVESKQALTNTNIDVDEWMKSVVPGKDWIEMADEEEKTPEFQARKKNQLEEANNRPDEKGLPKKPPYIALVSKLPSTTCEDEVYYIFGGVDYVFLGHEITVETFQADAEHCNKYSQMYHSENRSSFQASQQSRGSHDRSVNVEGNRKARVFINSNNKPRRFQTPHPHTPYYDNQHASYHSPQMFHHYPDNREKYDHRYPQNVRAFGSKDMDKRGGGQQKHRRETPKKEKQIDDTPFGAGNPFQLLSRTESNENKMNNSNYIPVPGDKSAPQNQKKVISKFRGNDNVTKNESKKPTVEFLSEDEQNKQAEFSIGVQFGYTSSPQEVIKPSAFPSPPESRPESSLQFDKQTSINLSFPDDRYQFSALNQQAQYIISSGASQLMFSNRGSSLFNAGAEPFVPHTNCQTPDQSKVDDINPSDGVGAQQQMAYFLQQPGYNFAINAQGQSFATPALENNNGQALPAPQPLQPPMGCTSMDGYPPPVSPASLPQPSIMQQQNAAPGSIYHPHISTIPMYQYPNAGPNGGVVFVLPPIQPGSELQLRHPVQQIPPANMSMLPVSGTPGQSILLHPNQVVQPIHPSPPQQQQMLHQYFYHQPQHIQMPPPFIQQQQSTFGQPPNNLCPPQYPNHHGDNGGNGYMRNNRDYRHNKDRPRHHRSNNNEPRFP